MITGLFRYKSIGSTQMPDQHDYPGPFRCTNGEVFCYWPENGTYIKVIDARDAILKKAEKCPGESQKEAFYAHRIKWAELAAKHDRTLSSSELASRAQSGTPGEALPCVSLPHSGTGGDVGYGLIYRYDKLTFQNSTALFYYATSAPKITDPRNKWLYLTATNHSPKGVEAFLYYRGNDESRFAIVDWSIEKWVLCLPHDALVEYVKNKTVGGQQYQTIYIVNSTRRVAATSWTNEVLLYNEKTKYYDLIYSSKYGLSGGEEPWHWGPIVETFDKFPYPTSDLGFFDAQIMQDSNPIRPLIPADTYCRNDYPGNGFELVFGGATQHYSFVVHWK
jgi:hypothetical protein